MNISTTTSTIDLTPEQLVTLLTNVYGLIDSYGVLFSTSEYSFSDHQGIIRLWSLWSNEESLDVSTEGASVDGAALTLLKDDGELEQFTLLGTVNGKDLLN